MRLGNAWSSLSAIAHICLIHVDCVEKAGGKLFLKYLMKGANPQRVISVDTLCGFIENGCTHCALRLCFYRKMCPSKGKY